MFIRKACQLSEPLWNPVWTLNSAPGRSRPTAQKFSPRDRSLVPGQVQHLILTNPNPPRPFSPLSCLRMSGDRTSTSEPLELDQHTHWSNLQDQSITTSAQKSGGIWYRSDPDGSVRVKF